MTQMRGGADGVPLLFLRRPLSTLARRCVPGDEGSVGTASLLPDRMSLMREPADDELRRSF